MGNKKKPYLSQDSAGPGSCKKAGELDKYFRDKVRVLTKDEIEVTPSSPCGSPPASPTGSEQSCPSGASNLKEILQILPWKEDLASMLAKLENSMQERLSSPQKSSRLDSELDT
ncbi:Hypothetical predicted protein [Pelobates cultripes]|uniref:Uncharacterized protein n=1 Tax=Pelobates cultripes TaxID=61616 RepID=A0AAD1TE41_PELCU|nr:Hypothetical predicted protein [Pelobates cultripes]